LCSSLQIIPNIAKLRNRAEDGALHFIDVMSEAIGTLYEFALGLVDDFQLNLANDQIVEFHIHEDIVGALFEPILYSNDLHLFRIYIADSLDFFENFYYFFFLG
jgi:hypothetical protein